jgi:hypothetical protein
MKLSMFSIANRRDFLKQVAVASASSLLLAACTTVGNVKTGPIYSAIVVDVEPVRAKNIGTYADKIGAYLKQSLSKTYAGGVDSGNKALPALTVEVHSIYFGAYGSDAPIGMGMTQTIRPMFRGANDSLDGYAVIRKGGKEVSRVNVYATHERRNQSPISSIDDEERLMELTQFYANQLRRELGD